MFHHEGTIANTIAFVLMFWQSPHLSRTSSVLAATVTPTVIFLSVRDEGKTISDTHNVVSSVRPSNNPSSPVKSVS